MRWEITGAKRSNGENAVLVLNAQDEESAIRTANDKGIRVFGVRCLNGKVTSFNPIKVGIFLGTVFGVPILLVIAFAIFSGDEKPKSKFDQYMVDLNAEQDKAEHMRDLGMTGSNSELSKVYDRQKDIEFGKRIREKRLGNQ